MFIIYTFRRRSLCKWTRPVQSFQVISEFADEIHRQSVIGFDGQLTNRGTSELTYQFALRINGSENS